MNSFLTDLGIAIKAKLDLKANTLDLTNKVDKVAGKQLSTEDYTTSEKSKLAGLSNYAKPSSEPISYIDGLQTQLDSKANLASLSAVATSGSYADLANKPTIPTVPTSVSAFTNDSGYQTSAQVNTAIQAVVGAAPAALDTLAEIANQLASDESAAAALTNAVALKANTSDVNSALALKANTSDVVKYGSYIGEISYISGETTLVGNAMYIISETNTTGKIINLPSSPTAGTKIDIYTDGTVQAPSITLGRNGKLIESSATDLIIDASSVEMKLVYVGPAIGWKVF